MMLKYTGHKIVEQTPSSVHPQSDEKAVKKVSSGFSDNTSGQYNQSQSYFKPISDFLVTKRNLPHWQSPGCIYFITFRTHDYLLLDEYSKQIIYDNIMHYSLLKYILYSFTVMNDHVHIILQPIEIEKDRFVNLAEIMKAIKGFAAKQIKKHLWEVLKEQEQKEEQNKQQEKQEEQTRASVLPKNIFQSESFDRIVRDDYELNEKLKYILNNSVKKRLCEDGYTYKWFYLNSQLDYGINKQM